MSTVRDPREIITPDAFTVAPELLGLPLARPARRAAAFLIDLALVGIVIKSISFTVFVLAAAMLLFRVARPSPRGGRLRRAVAWTVRVWAILLIGVFGVLVFNKVRDFIREPRFEVASDAEFDPDPDEPGLSIADARVLASLAQMQTSTDETTARAGAQSLAAWVRERSASADDRARDARWIMNTISGDTRFRAVLEQELAPFLGDVQPTPRDTAAVTAYLAAVQRADTVQAKALLDAAQTAIAGERIERLNSSAERLRAQRDSLRAEVERQRERGGLRRFVSGLADDLGVGFGWLAVYFTAFVVLMNGQTPGKRLLGIRIIRLDAKPLSWWLAFERFGGYAASFSTGLLGFAQILWDRNRQGMHDKFIATVVIREQVARADAAPRADHFAPPPRPTVPSGSRLPE